MTGFRKGRSKEMGWLRHVLTVLSVIIFLLGCVIIGYIAWVLATSVTVSKFVDGSMIWTYSVITIGFSLFFTGLMGWVGGASESPCLVRLFLVFVIVSLAAEIGGIITLKVLNNSFDDVLEKGWTEVNQGTRNIVQHHLSCCGWEGLEEFARNNEPIDDSCYERVVPSVSGIVARSDTKNSFGSTRRMKQVGCRSTVLEWFQENQEIWISIVAVVSAIQMICIMVGILILVRGRNRVRDRNNGRRASKKELYEDEDLSSDDSHSDRLNYRQLQQLQQLQQQQQQHSLSTDYRLDTGGRQHRSSSGDYRHYLDHPDYRHHAM